MSRSSDGTRLFAARGADLVLLDAGVQVGGSNWRLPSRMDKISQHRRDFTALVRMAGLSDRKEVVERH